MPDPDRLRGVPFRETALPTGHREPWKQRYVFPAAGEVQVICLSERMICVNTHFDATEGRGKMHYCPGPEECQFCRDHWLPFVYGYFAGQVIPGNGVHLISLPHSSLANSPHAVKLLHDARGLVLKVWRLKKSRFGPVIFTVDERRADRKKIPEGWDIKQDLMRRFGRVSFASRLGFDSTNGHTMQT